MLGGGDTTASVLVSSGGTDGNVAAASMVISGGVRDGSCTEGGGAVVAANVFASNGNNSNSGDDERVRVEEGERFYGGNRWPRQETLALLKIRSDMDVTFRDASVKGPLWEEVSRKLAELGYHRSAKKCKEKFENVLKYHKRTKDGRTGKADGKTYRFSDQLLALETHLSVHSPGITAAAPSLQLKPQNQTTMAAVNNTPSQPNNVGVTDPSATTVVPSLSKNTVPININRAIPSFPNVSADLMSDSTSSSTSSDLELEGRRKRKRKWKGFFEKLTKQVVQEQEEMLKKFLQAFEKREQDRMAREEAWRTQEIARINRECELLAQERSIASAKDAALMTLLQKFSDQKNPGQTQNNPPPQPPVSAIAEAHPAPPAAAAVHTPQPPPLVPTLPVSKTDNVNPSYRPSSSRWPKVEVEALIELRCRVDNQYPESVPKGSLWEDISVAMQSLGYPRNAKRCKEKWENINKYFKKVKDNHKNRGDDSKTCPYFHQLDALYRQKNKHETSSNQFNSVPLMVLHEQQTPPPPPPPPSEPYQHHQQRDHRIEDLESDQNEDNDEDEGCDYEIVASSSRQVSMGSASDVQR